jgi:hypothetical protein
MHYFKESEVRIQNSGERIKRFRNVGMLERWKDEAVILDPVLILTSDL